MGRRSCLISHGDTYGAFKRPRKVAVKCGQSTLLVLGVLEELTFDETWTAYAERMDLVYSTKGV